MMPDWWMIVGNEKANTVNKKQTSFAHCGDFFCPKYVTFGPTTGSIGERDKTQTVFK